METSSGIFARLAAEAATKGLEPPTLLALLKHPLLRLGRTHGAHRRGIETLEMALLRGTRPQAATSGLARDFARFRDELARRAASEVSSLHASEPRARLRDPDLDHAEALITALQAALSPLEGIAPSKPHDFAELAQRHREIIANLSADENGVVTAFDGQQGSVLASAFDDLLASQKQNGLSVQLGDYPEVFQTAFADPRRGQIRSTQLYSTAAS
jgi:ATP-dependent helicase/nuclease subunit B